MNVRERERQSGAGWFAGLDGLRALAVIAVVLYHFQPTALPGGFLGVDLFFVISGYLITRLLLTEIDLTGRLSLLDFYRRRVRRLLPALVVLLCAVVTASTLFWRDELPSMRGGVLSNLFYVGNWWLIADHQSYFVASGRPSMLQHLWSLAIEEQFYLLWPCLLAVLVGAAYWRKQAVTLLSASRLMGAATIALLLAVASTLAMAVIAIRSDVPYGADSSRVYFGTDTHSMSLLIGAAMGAVAVRARFWVAPRSLRGAFLSDLAAVLALLGLGRIMLTDNEFAPWLYRGGFLLIAALCAVLVLAVPRRGSLLGWLLERSLPRWIGQRSYGIYLWHWPVAVVTRPGIDLNAPTGVVLVLRIALTVVLAELSYRFVERPVRVGGWRGLAPTWRRPVRSPRVAALTVVGSVLVLGCLVTVFTYSTPHSGPASTPVALPAPGQPAPAPPRSSAARPATKAGSMPNAGAKPRPAATKPATNAAKPAPSTRATAKATPPKTVPVVAAPRPPAGSAVSAFGDSVMLGAAGALSAVLPDTHVYAVEGRQARAVFADIASRRAAHTLAPVVVIHTGDNGIVSPSDLRATLTALADRTRVVVVTDRVPRDWQAPNNQTLAQVSSQFRNVVLVDWYHRSSGHSSWFYPDGLHLRPAGAAAYAALIAQAIA